MLRMGVHINPDISVIAEHMNKQLCKDLPSGRFYYGVVYVSSMHQTKPLNTLVQGQAPLLHYMASSQEVFILDAISVPLGIFEAIDTLQVEKIQMNTGDMFAVISDGIFESKDGNGDQYETDRAIEVIKKSADMSAKDITMKLQESLNKFTGGTPADDDRTIIIIKCI